ncbi:IS3 family transposase [Actinoplanes xinjiangensis]|uniref:IS3 family transposase n=1 Tax=Actinoplanes xinjiangensis TaxID=512350 RepID=UPI00130EA484|nr:IS3 family transposase [Actinoplanes xinjiangensis]
MARSSYYYWTSAAGVRAARQAADTALAGQIRKIHAADNTYGVPRITAELRDRGTLVNHKRVERVMRGIGVDRRRSPRSWRPAETGTTPPRRP